MTNYLIKFMLLLMVTLSISQANATVVYYKNTKNWQTPTAHMWNGGEGTNFPGKAMTNLGDGWYSIDAGSNKNILFNNGSDKEKTGDLQIPPNVSAAAYVDGKWETVTYKIQHPWGESGTWTDKTLTDDGDGYYSLSEKWCDAECDVRCYISGSPVGDPYTIEKKNITLENNPQKGDVCTFTYNPADKSLTVTKGEPLPYKEVYIFGGVNVNEWDITKNYVKMECNEGVYTYNFTYDGKNNLWAFYARRKNGTATYLVQDAEVQNAEVTPSTPQEFKEMDNRNGKVFQLQQTESRSQLHH
ncbi:MAG: starch-binding protein [Porphyromonadaceae bacterium]|nr:MAG: starch-binding protein [Porphyromonadaceae bacterium]